MNRKTMMAGVIALATVGMSYGAVIQFDIGDNSGTYAGTDAPAALSGTSTNWNGSNGRNDIASGLIYADGTAATGVSLDIGSGEGTVDWTATGRGDSGNTSGTGIYAGALMGDWVYTLNENYGARVQGLAAGQYDVYALVREHNEPTRTYTVGIGVGDTGDILDLDRTDVLDATGVTTWSAGYNYVKTRVTVTSLTDYVTVIVDPTNEKYATLQGLQIVSVPEPATLGLITAFGGSILFIRRRFMM